MHLAVGTPFDGHLDSLVDKIYFTMERGTKTSGFLQKAADLGNILGIQRISAGSKQIQGLAIREEDRFLRFMDDHLCCRIKILARVFPYKGIIITFILDYTGKCHIVILLRLFKSADFVRYYRF